LEYELLSFKLVASIGVYLNNSGHELLASFPDPFIPVNEIVLVSIKPHHFASIVKVGALAVFNFASKGRCGLAGMRETD
jgi:hypothetical protein